VIKAFEKRPSTPQDNWEQHYIAPLCSKKIAWFCVWLFPLRDLVHVPGVRGVPQLDDPYLPGSATCLGKDVCTSISFAFLKSPVKFKLCGRHNHAAWAKLLFVIRGEVTRMHCGWSDQPAGEAFRVCPKFLHYHSRAHICCAVKDPQAAIWISFTMSRIALSSLGPHLPCKKSSPGCHFGFPS